METIYTQRITQKCLGKTPQALLYKPFTVKHFHFTLKTGERNWR